ncbi:CHAT domain-containing tetratricopeptide repeat protein [Microcoleus sp. bin38.metabat.b11b12b14.051]|uniref:CHAT domain-containing tetratricopeptide repeat protein n=1 Tax=Microcoleus sp. bin38.metabat.b11b12b14.051 TaxID=2742709 RepID=UPI0025EFFA02|nr:CHAT domain-containing tetratricopeptide repeat protein [Microcoleus sp. bin38.metabat.b11b12b14.051]
MNSERQQAYLNLINQLLTCPTGEEAEVLKSHPDLLDDGLVAAMLEEADNLRRFGILDNANRLMNCAGILLGRNNNSLVSLAPVSEADRLLDRGNQQYNSNQFREALQSYEQALTIYQEIGDRQGEANSLNGLGNAYYSLGDYNRAIDFYEQSLVINRKIGDRQGEANSLNGLGNAYYSLGDYNRAIDFYEQSLVINRKIGNPGGEANSLNGLGNAYYSLGDFNRAIDFYEQSLVINRKIGNPGGEANSLNGLGNAYYSLGDFNRAIDFYEQSLVIQRKIGNPVGEAASLGNLGNAYYSLGDYNRAIDFHEQSLVIKRKIGNPVGEAASLGNLGTAYQSLGDYNRAIDFYSQSLVIQRKVTNPVGEANSLNNLGNAYYSLGDYNRAIDFYSQSLVIQRKVTNPVGEANSLNNLGNAYYSLGDYNRAIDFYSQSLVIQRKVTNPVGEANSLNNLGNAYYSLGDYNRAIDFYSQSLVIQRKIGNPGGEAASLCGLGAAYKSLGDYNRAIDFHQQSLVIQRKIGNPVGEATSLCGLGLAYDSLGDYNRAIDFYSQSLVIYREIGNPVGESSSLNNLGETLFKINQFPEAEEKLRASIKIHETLRSKLVNNDHKASIFETQVETYRLLQQVLVAQAKFDEALEISEMGRTRAFVELLQQNLLTKDSTANELTNTLSIPRIQQIAQQKNSTIVEYSIIFKDIYIWVIQPNGNITHRAANLEPLNQQNQSLEQIILKTRVSIGVDEIDDKKNKIQLQPQYNRDETGGYPLLKILYQILIEPIADLLPTDPDSLVIFIPHYEIFLVPFTALQSANNRYLIEDHTILSAPSIQVLEQTSEHHQNIKGLRQAALIVGDPTIAAKFQENPYKLRQLSRAKEAAEAIATILGTAAISGENATKAAILDQMLNTRIIHLSAHGLLDDFPGSGIPGTIILAASGDTDDGALNAAEILQLKLNSELVVLSACSTGRGKITGDGVNGLSRCFILAGVPSIIISLWNMGAVSAKLLMTEFYQNLARGDNRAAALRRAMLTTKERFPSPIAWAAFTLIGETEILSLETQQIDLRKLKMSLPDNYTPEEIVKGLTKLLRISEPKLFVNDLPALDVSSTDRVNTIAEKIKAWCETRPSIEENLENEIEQCGPGGNCDDPPEEIEREFMETLIDNQIRLGLSRPSVPVVETDDSATESVED